MIATAGMKDQYEAERGLSSHSDEMENIISHALEYELESASAPVDAAQEDFENHDPIDPDSGERLCPVANLYYNAGLPESPFVRDYEVIIPTAPTKRGA